MTNQDRRGNQAVPNRKSTPAAAADVEAASASGYELLYPEIFYQLQPYVVEACDQLESTGSMLPTKDMLHSMGDKIERQFEFPGAEAVKEEVPAALRSRGLFRDLLDILLLTELFGRRRRYY